MINNYSKKIKRELRELAAQAYENELAFELTKLEKSFTEWRNGSISSSELNHRVHRHETGASKSLYKKYNYGDMHLNVAYAIVTGIVDDQAASEDLKKAIASFINFYQVAKDNGDIKAPEH